MAKPRPESDLLEVCFYLLLDITQQVAYIRRDIRRLENKMANVDEVLTRLEAAVTPLTDAKSGVITVINRLVQELKDAIAQGGNSAVQVARVEAILAAVEANQADLAAAVVANTPAAVP